jgi:serine/alanine racemase
MAVVKAQAYGHGAVLTASHLNKMGVRAFAVATIDEGIALRKGGVCGEILILGYTEVSRASELKEYDLLQTLVSFEYAEALNHQGIAVKVHIKIDTGMHRLGIACGELSAVRKVFFMENLNICGMFTHLCCSDSRHPDDVAFTRGQIDNFYNMADSLRDSGIILPKLHIQSSYGLLNYPDLACDYVRVGIALYGVLSSPADDTVVKPDLRPVLSLKSRVVLIRNVEAGENVGYGRHFTAGRDTRIAILPIGYGDGFPRNLSDPKGSVLIDQYVVPVVGRICMDQLAVDITDTDGVSVGDIVTLAGAEGYDKLSVPVVADSSGSISNELLCRMGARLPVIAR